MPYSMQRRLARVSTLFHVEHSDDVTSDDFYETPARISDDTRAGTETAHNHLVSSPTAQKVPKMQPRLRTNHG